MQRGLIDGGGHLFREHLHRFRREVTSLRIVRVQHVQRTVAHSIEESFRLASCIVACSADVDERCEHAIGIEENGSNEGVGVAHLWRIGSMRTHAWSERVALHLQRSG